MNKRTYGGALAAMALACLSQPALAQSAGTWSVGVGAHQVSPSSDNGSVLDGDFDLEISENVQPTVTLEYFIRNDLGIEVLASIPFEHDIDIVDVGQVATTKQLPPTVTLQYHFNSRGMVSPFVGAGINYTLFFSEKTTGALEGTTIKLKDSWGPAAHAGVDFMLGESGAIRVDVRWMDIDTDVEVDGVKIGTAQIDPLAYGVAYVYRF
jgi:outer membrane protein